MLTEGLAKELLSGITTKQREVLDLVNEHQTSKEIARRLGVSPNTVDQRIAVVRERWNTPNRKATMRLYNQLLLLTDSGVGNAEGGGNQQITDIAHGAGPAAQPEPILTIGPLGYFSLQSLDENFGAFGRVIAMLGITFLLVMIGAATLYIAEALSRSVYD